MSMVKADSTHEVLEMLQKYNKKQCFYVGNERSWPPRMAAT